MRIDLEVIHDFDGEDGANDNRACPASTVRPMAYLTEAGDEARMRAACALAQVMSARGWSGRQVAQWFRVDEKRVREMLDGRKPIALERLMAPEVPASAVEAILDAMKAARRAA